MDAAPLSKIAGADSLMLDYPHRRSSGTSPRMAMMLGAVAGVLGGWLYATSMAAPALRAEALAASPSTRPYARNRSPSDDNADAPNLQDAVQLAPQPADSALQRPDPFAANRAGLADIAQKVKAAAICPDGMQLVQGDYCTTVIHHCLEPYNDGSGRCGRYAKVSRCLPPILTMRFCIDEFEFPNRAGEKPRVMVDFPEAVHACQSEGKRLCAAREWTLACEGPDRLPYPNGYVRDRDACNIDLPHRFPDIDALSHDRSAQQELARLDQRARSGTRPGCISQYGVHDLVGNVDEWVVPDGPEEAAGLGARTALKGGYFGAVRARCRPSTPTHGPTFKFYQVGFRCCRDVPTANPGD